VDQLQIYVYRARNKPPFGNRYGLKFISIKISLK